MPALARVLKETPTRVRRSTGLALAHCKDFVRWIEAKRDEPRDRRVSQTLGMLCHGKTRS